MSLLQPWQASASLKEWPLPVCVTRLNRVHLCYGLQVRRSELRLGDYSFRRPFGYVVDIQLTRYQRFMILDSSGFAWRTREHRGRKGEVLGFSVVSVSFCSIVQPQFQCEYESVLISPEIRQTHAKPREVDDQRSESRFEQKVAKDAKKRGSSFGRVQALKVPSQAYPVP